MNKIKIVKYSVDIECGFCKENHIVEIDPDGFLSGQDECQLCGSHGSIEVYVRCPCGKSTYVVIKEW